MPLSLPLVSCERGSSELVLNEENSPLLDCAIAFSLCELLAFRLVVTPSIHV